MRSNHVAVLFVICLGIVSCWNDNFDNDGVVTGGRRFQLVIEPARTSVEGTHFLIDTATGDLWKLEAAAVGQHWARLTVGPEDVRPVTFKELLGVEIPEKPTAQRP